ncbi:MAG: hypothetical protein HUU38_10865 [Anaerolineales bacterium]|nr:hypothetical protein [Anaerolineales bacterium]
MNLEFQATSEMYWWSAVITVLVDSVVAWLLIPRITQPLFLKLRNEIVLASVAFWGGLWGSVMASDFIWESCYQYVFSPAARWYWPLMEALLNGGVAWLFWWLALKISDRPVFNFLILGGLVSLPGHLWAMFARGIMDTPLLKNVSMESALTFGIFEFIFYWTLILSGAVLIHKIRFLAPKTSFIHGFTSFNQKRTT